MYNKQLLQIFEQTSVDKRKLNREAQAQRT